MQINWNLFTFIWIAIEPSFLCVFSLLRAALHSTTHSLFGVFFFLNGKISKQRIWINFPKANDISLLLLGSGADKDDQMK